MTKYFYHKFADSQNKDSFSYKLREKRFQSFINLLKVQKNDTILDVGGYESRWIGLKYNVTLLNLSFYKKMDDFEYVIGDACDMKMFLDKSFDIIYSNSVIEHVGREKQNDFAREIERVGKKYWVQTPYKHFPLEPHFVFPFFQYYPIILQKFIGLKWPYSHFNMGNAEEKDILNEISKIYLLNKSELKILFKDAEIYEEKFLGIIKSITAFRI